MSILSVSNLKKSYGDLKALKGISFNIEKGEIFALIGPNGAGKTTTLRIIATILKKDEGEIYFGDFVYGKDDNKIRENISYLPEEAGVYKNLTGQEYLDFMASFFAKNREDKKKFIEKASEICGLGDRLKNKVTTYSKGMTRKLLLARSIMFKPKLAILDEPTSGLDVQNAFEIRKIIKSFKEEGMSVLLSSHNMLEIEFLSDRVGFIYKGNILEIGKPEELKKKFNKSNLEEVFIELISLNKNED
ncbi:MAG: ABC transporter ATP-binding protein [Spirochaetes bacterium]|nr:ABC transporter ATP-binding protein [Spirochaetota bacterium]